MWEHWWANLAIANSMIAYQYGWKSSLPRKATGEGWQQHHGKPWESLLPPMKICSTCKWITSIRVSHQGTPRHGARAMSLPLRLCPITLSAMLNLHEDHQDCCPCMEQVCHTKAGGDCCQPLLSRHWWDKECSSGFGVSSGELGCGDSDSGDDDE